ncbi:MAG: hypothetical protein ABI609_12160 [Acidobacteriota bacterium]
MTLDRLRALLGLGLCCLWFSAASLEAQTGSAAGGENGASEPLPAPVPKPRTAKKKPVVKAGLIARDASFAEMEAAIVSGTGLYVMLDPLHKVLEVRSRGLVLDRVHLSGIEFLSHSPIFGGGADAVPSLPATWVVAEDASDFEREVIAPDTLRSYVPEDQRTAVDEARNPKVIAAHEEGALPPSTYQVKLTNGWALAVLDQAPKTSFFARFDEALKEGWKRLRGVKGEHPPMLAVAMSGEDAQRIHHLFRAELPVLIAPGKG